MKTHHTSTKNPVSKSQNAQDEPTAESGFAKPAEAAPENPAGGGSAPSLCSAALNVSDKQITQASPEDAYPGASKGDWCASSRKLI